jgi:hypothetical protein
MNIQPPASVDNQCRLASVTTIVLVPAAIFIVVMPVVVIPVVPVRPAATEQQQPGQHDNPCSLAFHVRTSSQAKRGLAYVGLCKKQRFGPGIIH